jgi:hypothetical protein
MTTVGEQFARALAAKDFGRIEAVVDLDTGRMVDRDRVAWRFAVSTPE